MRHNRRAVMSERYKLYMRKNIFNGRYFVRNMQIMFCAIALIAIVIGGIVLANSGNEDKKQFAKNDKISVMDALFGENEEITEATTEKVTEEVVATEEVQVAVATEAVVTEQPTTEPIVAYTEQTVASQPEGEFDEKCIANVEETLNIRSIPSTEGGFVGSMNAGAIAIVEGTDGDWTKIKSGEVEGYVLTQYILTGKSAEEFAKDYVTLQGTILEDGVNVRTEESTSSNIVTVLDKDATVIVLEDPREEDTEGTTEMVTSTETASTEEVTTQDTETATSETLSTEVQTQMEDTEEAGSSETASSENDTEISTEADSEASTTQETSEAVAQVAAESADTEITWLPVMLADGQTGYVSADLVDVDRLYEIAVSAEELQRREEERLAAEKAAAEAAALAAQQQTQVVQSTTSTSSNSTSSDSSSSTEYQGATTTPVTATSSGECIGTFTVTAYCGCKKCSGGNGKTASGTTPTEGRTIAADTSVLPYGSQVVIDGVVYTVEDCGSGVRGNHIDIFFATHEKAVAYGSKTVKVYKY